MLQQRLLESADSVSFEMVSFTQTSTLPVGHLRLRWNAKPIPIQLAPQREAQNAGDSTIPDPWEAQNTQRMALIRKNLAKTISTKESEELEGLQRDADARIRQLAPLPLDELKAFAEELKQRGIAIPD